MSALLDDPKKSVEMIEPRNSPFVQIVRRRVAA